MHNVDMRCELLSLIFRLAGRPEYSSDTTDYQKSLIANFSQFTNHPAVAYARDYGNGYGAPIAYAIRMNWENEKCTHLYDIPDLAVYGWDETWLSNFIPLINDFYTVTKFGEFFQENVPYYHEVSARFNDQLYRKFNKDWFAKYGIKPEFLRVSLSPNRSGGGFGPSIKDGNGNIVMVYPNLPDLEDYSSRMPFLVHEFCHSFADSIGQKFYEESEMYRKICDEAMGADGTLPEYNAILPIIVEYATRAYTILYLVENEGKDPAELFPSDIDKGFPHIAEVYAMIKP